MGQQNFFYSADPSQDIGSSLATALFGNRELAQKQAQARAEIAAREAAARESDAHAQYYTRQAEGAGYQNTQAQGVPEAIAGMYAPPAAPIDTWYRSPEDQQAAQQDVFKAGLGNLIAHLAGQQGDKVDPRQIIGALSAFAGNDELARRGLVAQGQSPSKDFAVTPERADQISARDAGESLSQAMGVARVNHAADVPVANIRAGASRAVAGINHASDVPVANIGAWAQADAARIRQNGAPGFEAIGNALPGAFETSGLRSPAQNAAVDGVPNSYHLGRPGAQGYDIRPIPGLTIEQAKAHIEATNPGMRVVEARDESHRPGHGAHWHFALQAPPVPAKPKARRIAPSVAPGASGPRVIRTKAEYDLLPRGTEYIAPDGSHKRKG